MAPKKPEDSSDGSLTLTPGDARCLKAMFDSMIDKPNVDWSQVAEQMSIKTPKGARDRYWAMTKKYDWGLQTGKTGGSGQSSSSSKSAPIKAGKGLVEGMADEAATDCSGGKVTKRKAAGGSRKKKPVIGLEIVKAEGSQTGKAEGSDGDDSLTE